MIPGFNTDFKYRGETYHVQTEDNGEANPVVVTLLYHKGAILASRKTSYRDLLNKPGLPEQLRELMTSQHKNLMRELLAGSLNHDGAAPAASGSGEHPAEAAAAAVAVASEKPAPAAPAPRPVVISAPRAPVAPAPRRPVPATLDEMIMRYLEAHSAAAAPAH